LALLLDEGFEEHDKDLVSTDPLKFEDSKKYSAKLKAASQASDSNDAVISVTGMLDGHKVNVCAMEFRFMGGSMGAVVGEKITRAVERSVDQDRDSADHRVGVGRRAHAGRRGQPDATGQDLRGADALDRGGRAVHQRADGSDDGRRDGQLRDAGRSEHRRARRV
jgi:hypothetical protein